MIRDAHRVSREHERAFDLFGTSVRILVGGPAAEGEPGPELAAAVAEAVLWSCQLELTRFDPDSELRRLNADPAPARVRRMCESMVEQVAAIHRVDLCATGLGALGDGRDFLSRELDHWAGEMERVKRGPIPALERLLALLAEGSFYSGQQLARKLKISRGGIWKLVRSLKALGVDIDSVARQESGWADPSSDGRGEAAVGSLADVAREHALRLGVSVEIGDLGLFAHAVTGVPLCERGESQRERDSCQ